MVFLKTGPVVKSVVCFPDKRIPPVFAFYSLYQLFMEPFTTTVAENIHYSPENPVYIHTDIDTQNAHGGEDGVEQETQCHPEREHGENGKGNGVTNIACCPECA